MSISRVGDPGRRAAPRRHRPTPPPDSGCEAGVERGVRERLVERDQLAHGALTLGVHAAAFGIRELGEDAHALVAHRGEVGHGDGVVGVDAFALCSI